MSTAPSAATSTRSSPLRLVEFYAGVGGWHVSVKLSGVDIDVVAALDINTTANAVYRHNFPHTPLLQRNICGLSTRDLDSFNADIFTLSPPCQPFTRQGKKGDSDDRRTDSFFHMMHIMATMSSPPRYLMVENVLGFEVSSTRQHLIQLLTGMGYSFQEFLLSPKQFGIPNSRLRYYLLAKLTPLTFSRSVSSSGPCRDVSTVIEFIPSLLPSATHSAVQAEGIGSKTHTTGIICSNTDQERAVNNTCCHTIRERADFSQSKAPGVKDTSDVAVQPLSAFLQNGLSEEELQQYLVPDKLLLKYAMGLDIVQPSSTCSCCFTRGYFHYAVGTGSVVQHAHGEDLTAAYQAYCTRQAAEQDEEAIAALRTLKLRYFTPREVANLMCFPSWFSLPEQLTVKQCYRVVGNSVNALVVSTLLRYLLAS